MDTTRPITDYEVECTKHYFEHATVGTKYRILSETENFYSINDDRGIVFQYDKDGFGEPSLIFTNPDIDLLDKFAMAALTGHLANYHNKLIKWAPEICYEVANAMLQERKKYLTINTPDNG